MLGRMGFGHRWRKLIRACVTFTFFSIIDNGAPKGYFPSSKGLRQGDPLSPLLFFIVAEGLSGLIRKDKKVGLIHGFSIENSLSQITHLQFVNDTLILFYFIFVMLLRRISYL